MQILDPLDPTMIIFYGLAFTLIVLLYASRTRKSDAPLSSPDSVSSMSGGRVDFVTTGAVQEPMLDHLVSVEEERIEHESELL